MASIHTYEYLKDTAFLKEFDKIKLKQQIVKIIVLDFKENPIQQIQGRVTGGSITLDGNSSMRRTCNLSLVLNDEDFKEYSIKSLLSINKKVEILIGFKNTTNQYTNYPILWFPQGIYAIISINFAHDSNGVSISLTLHDKMAFLNGQCGGTLSASVVFHEVEDINQDGQVSITQPTIYQIIQQLVNHFGGQQIGKIIISDIDNKIKRVMKWTGSTPIYIYQSDTLQGGLATIKADTNYQELIVGLTQQQIERVKTYSYGDDIGYILTDFSYPTELIGNAGDTVVTILDQIKNVLGNYEYFYDLEGNFVFRQIKNYLNKSFASVKLNELNANNYLADYTNGKSVYIFDDNEMIISYSNAPQYENIKNDFVIWGKKTSIDGIQIPIRYHLAIDERPKVGNTYKLFFFEDPDDNIIKAKKAIPFENLASFPEKGNIQLYYLNNENNKVYKWSDKTRQYQQTDYEIKTITTKDYRTQLYCAGTANQPFGLESNYYYTELKNQWPKIYDIEQGQFFEQALNFPSEIDYFLDFIDTSAAISQFSIQNIGRRTLTITDDTINCIFQPSYPNIVFIDNSQTEKMLQLKKQCEKRKLNYFQLKPETYALLLGGGTLKSAYEEIKRDLYQFTSYNEQISLTTIPIYYLEPNVRITVRDPETNIYGDYIIQSINLPLDISGTMSISCTKALTRF